ncbi:MAG: hypothetical protein ABSA47_17015 [Verrucomicrobiota bacterium]
MKSAFCGRSMSFSAARAGAVSNRFKARGSFHPRLAVPRGAGSGAAHLATTTLRYANSLAPRSGERVRERGSFNPVVVVSRGAGSGGNRIFAVDDSAPTAHSFPLFWQE